MVFAALVVTAVSNQTIDKKDTKPMIAVYAVDRWYKKADFQSPEEIVSFLQEHNVNAVFGGYDDVDFRNACKTNGIKVFADLLCFQGEKYWKQHPESRPIGADGNPIEKEEWYCGVCPNQEWLRREILEKARKLVTDYKVDGVWLDFIRYPCHWEVKEPNLYQSCFCDTCIDLFTEETGTSIPLSVSHNTKEVARYILDNYEQEWTRFKCQRIAGFVRQIAETIEKENPDVILGLFGVPWRMDEYDGAIHAIVGQDFELLARSGVDIFSPMVYHGLCYRNVQWIAEVADYFHTITGKSVVPIVQACSIPNTLSNEEFAQAVKAGLEPPSLGVIIFHATYLEKEAKWDTFKTVVSP